MGNDVNKIRDLLESFIKRMNEWEIACNDIASDNTLKFEEQHQKQKDLVTEIFDIFCTKKERKYGRPTSISYGSGEYFEYDPQKEIVTEIVQDDNKPRKMHAYTYRENPLEEKFEYVFVYKNKQWLIDTKKVYSERNSRWEPVYL